MHGGVEWLVDAEGCAPSALRDEAALRGLLERIVRELDLHVIGEPFFHRFPAPGGITALALLSESHLAAHTFPESGTATFNLYCCRPRAEWPWAARLAAALGAAHVDVRRVTRGADVPAGRPA